MNAPARRRSTPVITLLAFLAALLPLAAATIYFQIRAAGLAAAADERERRLAAFEALLQPIGNIEQLRSGLLARKRIVDVLREPQRGLQAALALIAELPAGVRLLAAEVDAQRLSLQLAPADTAAATQLRERVERAGFADVTLTPAAAADTATISARLDPARFRAPAAATPEIP